MFALCIIWFDFFIPAPAGIFFFQNKKLRGEHIGIVDIHFKFKEVQKMIIYGICFTQRGSVNNDKAEAFLRELSSVGYGEYLEEFEENQKDNEENRSSYRFSDWMDDYENMGHVGLAAFLSDVIKNKEHIDIYNDDYNGLGYLGLAADVPWNFKGKTKDLSGEEYIKIISSYWNKVSDQGIDFSWFTL